MATSAIQKQITAGARSVIQLAVHLKELGLQAAALTESINARDRGYFLPGEDEQVRHVLVSYWKSRAALFEVVDSLRQHVDFSEAGGSGGSEGAGGVGAGAQARTDHQAFVVGYAAAVILVDAARTLREMFEEVPLVRDKLNEADTVFGIPQGVYNTVQKSLTSPNNAWYLHQANTYYDENHNVLLTTTKQNAQLGAVFAIIKELGHRVRVSPGEYAKARIDVQADQLKRGLGEKGVGRAMYWVQELVGRLIGQLKIRPMHQPHLPDQIIAQLTPMLKPGDVFVTRKEFAATNYFLPGYWPHAALYLGDIDSLIQCNLSKEEQFRSRWQRLLDLDTENPHRVLEAMADGVWLRSINSPFSVDAVVVIRPTLTPSQVVAALCRGMTHESKPYDFDFDFTRSDRLVCTEVIYRSYEGIDDMGFDLTRRAGRMTFSAEDLLRKAMDGNGFEPVAVYAGEHDSQLVTEKRAREILAQTVAPV